MILKCDCKDEYQDKKYGKGMRVHTPTSHSGQAKVRQGEGDYKCCRCLKVHRP